MANADGSVVQYEEEEETTPGGGRVVPEDMLQTDTRVGLTSEEVLQRRRKYGLNQMKYVHCPLAWSADCVTKTRRLAWRLRRARPTGR